MKQICNCKATMAIMCFLVIIANNNGMFYIVFMYTCRQYWDNSSVSLTDVFQEKKCFYVFFLIKQVEKSQQNWGKNDEWLQMLIQGQSWSGYFKEYHPVKSWTPSPSTFLRSLWNGNDKKL